MDIPCRSANQLKVDTTLGPRSSTYFLASRDVLLCNVGQWVDFGEGAGAQCIGFGKFGLVKYEYDFQT